MKYALPQKCFKKHEITHSEGTFFQPVINWKKIVLKNSSLCADPFNGRNTFTTIALIMIIILKVFTSLFIYCLCCKYVNTSYAIKDFTNLCSILVGVLFSRAASLSIPIFVGKCMRKWKGKFFAALAVYKLWLLTFWGSSLATYIAFLILKHSPFLHPFHPHVSNSL